MLWMTFAAQRMDAPPRRRTLGHMPTGRQLRSARALIGWTAAELAKRAGVSWNTVQRAEAAGDEVPTTRARALAAIVAALTAAGVEFTSNATGVGVRLRRR